jgi:hypothetical protein
MGGAAVMTPDDFEDKYDVIELLRMRLKNGPVIRVTQSVRRTDGYSAFRIEKQMNDGSERAFNITIPQVYFAEFRDAANLFAQHLAKRNSTSR